MSRGWRITLSDILFLGILASTLLAGHRMLGIDSDLGRHLTLGNYILEHRFIPTLDLFSHTLTGHPRPPYEWLSQVFFAISNKLLGLDGVILLTGLVLAVTTIVIFRLSLQGSQSPLIALMVTLLAAAATSIHWLPRPHIVTLLLLSIWVHMLERVRIEAKFNIYLFPIIMLLWANLHGGFIFGFLAFGAYLAGWAWEKWKKSAGEKTGLNLMLGLTLTLIASVITPNFWHNWEAVLNNRSAFILSRTVETMPPDLSSPTGAPFMILLILSIGFGVANVKQISASRILLLGGFGILGLLMARNIPLFAVVCAPILAEWISSTLNRLDWWKRIESRYSNFGILNKFPLLPIIAVVVMIGYFGNEHMQSRQVYQFDPQVFPVQAVDWLEKNPIEGKMFNEFNWGGYILYRTWSRDLVFLDSQSDFYGESLIRDYEAVMLTQGDWRKLLQKYDVNWVIMPGNTPLAKALVNDTNWIIRYQDSVAIILSKQ